MQANAFGWSACRWARAFVGLKFRVGGVQGGLFKRMHLLECVHAQAVAAEVQAKTGATEVGRELYAH